MPVCAVKQFFPYARCKAESQFASLERPANAIVVGARLPLEDVVEQIVSALKSPPPAKEG
jgi:gluconate kinase